MRYTWDPTKAKSNLRKHGVSFEEGKSVLSGSGRLLIEFETEADEERFKALGMSSTARCLMVVFCERDEDEVRIISARKATRNEVKRWQNPRR